MRAHPFNLISVHVGGRVFDGGGQVEDDLVVDRGLPYVGYRFADFQSELELRAGETFRRIFEAHASAVVDQGLGVLFDPLGALHGDVYNIRFGRIENMFALGG